MKIDLLHIHHEVNYAFAETRVHCLPDPEVNTFTEQTTYAYLPPRPAVLIQDLLLEQLKEQGIENAFEFFAEESREDLKEFDWTRGKGHEMGFCWQLENGYLFEYEVTQYDHGLVAHTPFIVQIEEIEPELPASPEFLEMMEDRNFHQEWEGYGPSTLNTA